MSLAQDIHGFRDKWQPHQGPSCKIGLLIDLMSEEDLVAFSDLLSSQVYGTDIADLVQSWADREDMSQQFRDLASGVRGDTLQRHRRGSCMCGRGKAD